MDRGEMWERRGGCERVEVRRGEVRKRADVPLQSVARSVYNNIQRNAVPSLPVPSLPNMAVHVMAEGAIASRGPVPMPPESVRCC
jgi:hypothetical protein